LHIHRRNAAERAIRTFKNHFLAGFLSCNPFFPLREWDRLLPQSILTLNLLRNARLNPKLSAHAFLFDNYDFNRCPLVPPGTQVIIHSKPSNRRTFFPHDVPIPKVSTEDYLRQAASNIVNLLTNQIANLPFLHVGYGTQNALLQIAQLLNRLVDTYISLDAKKNLKNSTLPTPVRFAHIYHLSFQTKYYKTNLSNLQGYVLQGCVLQGCKTT